ncbi:DUF4260 domain-containing protein [Pelagibacterium lacus]|uniref:DUF4260 family protein n=1 Tax=Pelagibacterium lacus TaxID=2282655 RepID=A0A369W0C8_9HYPH|nr:DUF4260 domain-containing protein [Pelagibacterium lacus]RDE07833.1 DUF4260 family protein [Pelagibacterium lacus]
MQDTVLWQRLEGAVVFVVGIWLYLLGDGGLTWWLAILVFFVPDLSFSGYLLGPKVGAFTYNLVHVYAFGAAFLVAGTALSLPMLSALGALWIAHSGFDRMLGYGLKSTEGFHFTHLGRIGKQSHE